jgi:hypothetical protein
MKRVAQLLLIGAILTWPAYAHAAHLPTDEEVNGALKLCGGGRVGSVAGDIKGGISLWKRQAEAGGSGSISDLAGILSKVPNDKQLDPENYKEYISCVKRVLDLFSPKQEGSVGQPAPPGVTVSTIIAYSNLEETSISMGLASPSGDEEDLHKLRIGFYDATDKPIPITESSDITDVRLPRKGEVSFLFSLVAHPQTLQICTEIADPSSGQMVATKRLFMVFHNYSAGNPNLGGQFFEATASESQQLQQRLGCPSGAPSSTANCSPLLQALSSDPPAQLPELEGQALSLAINKAPDARLSWIAVSDTNGRLAPEFNFTAAQSGKAIGVFVDGCRLRANVSDYNGSGSATFDGTFIDLPIAISAARAKGLRGKLTRADLNMEPERPHQILVWKLQGNYPTDLGTFYAVAATPGAQLNVWRCRVVSMDGSRYTCSGT